MKVAHYFGPLLNRISNLPYSVEARSWFIVLAVPVSSARSLFNANLITNSSVSSMSSRKLRGGGSGLRVVSIAIIMVLRKNDPLSYRI